MSDQAETLVSTTAASAVESYSIRVASRLTGIPADTLRMWERRYGFPSPQRRATGVRSYVHDDIERLLLISRALRLGYRPGEVVGKSRGELEQQLASAGSRSGSTPRSPSVNVCIEAVERFDPAALAGELRRAIAVMGEKQFLIEVAQPLVQRVRELWIEGQMGIRHERLVLSALSAQVRQLLSTYEAAARTPSFLVTTLPGEPVDIGPELAALFIAVSGALPRVLGDMPPDQVVEAARSLGSDVICVSVSEGSNLGAAASQLRWIIGALPAHTEVWVTGIGSDRLDVRGTRIQVIQSWGDFERHIQRLRQNGSTNGASHGASNGVSHGASNGASNGAGVAAAHGA
jgi:hypothetical protein